MTNTVDTKRYEVEWPAAHVRALMIVFLVGFAIGYLLTRRRGVYIGNILIGSQHNRIG